MGNQRLCVHDGWKFEASDATGLTSWEAGPQSPRQVRTRKCPWRGDGIRAKGLTHPLGAQVPGVKLGKAWQALGLAETSLAKRNEAFVTPWHGETSGLRRHHTGRQGFEACDHRRPSRGQGREEGESCVRDLRPGPRGQSPLCAGGDTQGKFPTAWPKVTLPIALFDTRSHFLSSPIFLAVRELFPLGCSANGLN